MKKKYLLLIIILISEIVKSQVTINKSWDYRYGGNDFDFPSNLLKTLDGGYLMSGNSLSQFYFEKSETNRGGLDYWIIKTDSLGNKLWDKTFGGSETEYLTCNILLPDSGYLIGGYSSSGVSGDKTQYNGSPLLPTDDYWVIRIDKIGNKIWDKTFGGNKKDRLNSLLLLPDGNYLLGGYSISDGTGDMTNNSYGDNDFWLIKIDPSGNKLWDTNFGGIYDDRLVTLSLTTDNCIILGGYSNSPSGICKTQSTCNNSYDYWIIKINQNGIKLWDKTYGGTSKDNYSRMAFLPGDKMILCGVSFPGMGCDKTEPNYGNLGYTDYWVVCTDSSGNKLWDKIYGGDRNEDELNNVSLIDEGILITGTSYSFITGDKSENNVLSAEQPWLIAIDTLGKKIWDKTIHNPTHTEFCFGFQESDGCYIILSNVVASGGYVSQVRNSGDDYWLAKFCINKIQAIANYSVSSQTLCQNTCINFTNLSQNATSFQWQFPGGIPSSDTTINPPSICYFNQGTYDVTLIASNSNDTDTFTFSNFITVHPQLQFSPLSQIGDTLFSIQGYIHYEWFLNNNILTGENNYYLIAKESGNYSVLVIDSNGCQALANKHQVIASTDELKNKTIDFTAKYFFGSLYVNLISNLEISADVEFTDALGKLFFSKKIWLKNGMNVASLPTDNIPPGIYFLKLTSSNQMATLKFFLN